MTKTEKNELYDELCHLLTDFENDFDDEIDEQDLYNMLVKIQNAWGEITSPDE